MGVWTLAEQIPVSPLTYCVRLHELLNISESQHPPGESRDSTGVYQERRTEHTLRAPAECGAHSRPTLTCSQRQLLGFVVCNITVKAMWAATQHNVLAKAWLCIQWAWEPVLCLGKTTPNILRPQTFLLQSGMTGNPFRSIDFLVK